MLFKLTGWKWLRPTRAPWGESTSHWTAEDWNWFRNYKPPHDDGGYIANVDITRRLAETSIGPTSNKIRHS